MLGSGVASTGSALVVRGPVGVTERTWLVSTPACTYISNSLALVLAGSGSALDLDWPHYEADFMSFVLGRRRMREVLPLRGHGDLRQFVGHRLVLDSWRSWRTEPDDCLCTDACFETYESYRDHLVRRSELIVRNACDAQRSVSYTPLATVSKGYDSPACAVVAREVGAAEAITFTESRGREGREGVDDSGTAIGRALGLTVHETDRERYKSAPVSDVRAALAGAGGGEDVPFIAFSDVLARKLVFTGYMGDSVWGKTPIVDPMSGKGLWAGSKGMSEFRIRTGFVHYPLPWCDYQRQHDIAEISTAPEMSGWRIDSVYDRPIPRRIVETAGIPRSEFGQAKAAISAPLYYTADLEDLLGQAAASAFRRWCDRNDVAARVEAYARVRSRMARINSARGRLADIFEVRLNRPGIARRVRPGLQTRWRREPSPGLWLMVWTIETLREEYVTLLKST